MEKLGTALDRKQQVSAHLQPKYLPPKLRCHYHMLSQAEIHCLLNSCVSNDLHVDLHADAAVTGMLF